MGYCDQGSHGVIGGNGYTALLIRLISEGYEVSCVSYDYGQKHIIELEKAKQNIRYTKMATK